MSALISRYTASAAQFLMRPITWGKRAVLAIADQGLISGSNFVINVLLARSLTPRDYGAYGVAFGALLLVLLAHQALLLEPMSVFGVSTYGDRQSQYVRSLLLLHAGFAGVVFVILAAVGLAVQTTTPTLMAPIFGVAVAGPMVALYWLVRRAAYLRFDPVRAVKSSIIYCVLVFGGMLLLWTRGYLTPLTAFLLMGAGSLVASTLLALNLRIPLSGHKASPALRDVASRHWVYGRWALVSALATWVPWNAFYFFLAWFTGMEAVGSLRALLNLTTPIAQVFTALSLLFLPYAAKTSAERGAGGVWQLGLRSAGAMAAVCASYWILLLLLRTPVMHAMYGNRFHELTALLWPTALASMMWCSAYGPVISLRALQSPASVFFAYAGASATSVLVGVPLAFIFGLRGALMAINVSSAMVVALAFLLLRRKSTIPAEARSRRAEIVTSEIAVYQVAAEQE